jgi:transposase
MSVSSRTPRPGALHPDRSAPGLGSRLSLSTPSVRSSPDYFNAGDAEAIGEAAQRPTLRFVALKSANQQAAAVVFRTRDLLVRQRTQALHALRGHLAEFGVIAAKGPVHTAKLMAALEDPASALPQAARGILAVLVEELRSLDERLAVLDREIARQAKENPVARRLMTIPGIGAVTAAALNSSGPPGRDGPARS